MAAAAEVATIVPAQHHWVLAIAPSLICVLSDYIGLCALMPVLPFHCRDSGISDVELWTGAISSSQFAAVMLACVLMGPVIDRVGAKRSMQLAMTGNVVTFVASAWAVSPVLLLFVRFCAGLSSPLVPALASIFEAVSAERAVHGTSAYMLAVVLGMQLGAAAVGLYDLIRWRGIALLSGGISLLALVSTVLLRSARRTIRPKPLRVLQALCSQHFATHAATAFSIGYSFTSVLTLLPLVLMQRGWPAAHVSLVAFALALPTAVAAVLSPALTRCCGVQGAITCGLLVQLICAALLCAPSCAASPAVLITMCVMIQFAVFTEQPPNNSRAKAIGQHLTSGGTGTVTGWSRFVFSAGCATGPVVSLVLHGLAIWAPWLLVVAVQALTVVAYLVCGVSLVHDPDWGVAREDTVSTSHTNSQIASTQASEWA